MREFVFTIEYEKSVDEVMDLFIEHPNLHARSMEVHATDESVWEIDEVSGRRPSSGSSLRRPE